MKGNDMKKANAGLVVTGAGQTVITRSESQSPTRLDSWKDIAAYFNRSVRTVQRWEAREGMPVQRHTHAGGGSLFAYRHQLDAWRAGRSQLGRMLSTVPVIQRAPVRSLPLEQQSALRALLEAILQQLGEETARSRAATAPDKTFGQSASEEALAATADSRIAGDNIDGKGIQPRPLLPKVQ
jgi:hypothetical protein